MPKKHDNKKESLYSILQSELKNEYHRTAVKIIALVLGSILGIVGLIVGIVHSIPYFDVANGVLFLFFIGFAIVMLAVLSYQNMNQSEFEEKFIMIGSDLLRKKKAKNGDIDLIEKRAEIGSNTGSGRILLPILVIPFLIAFFEQGLPAEIQFLLLVIIIFIGSMLIFELDRANLDIMIRQICIYYRYSKNMK